MGVPRGPYGRDQLPDLVGDPGTPLRDGNAIIDTSVPALVLYQLRQDGRRFCVWATEPGHERLKELFQTQQKYVSICYAKYPNMPRGGLTLTVPQATALKHIAEKARKRGTGPPILERIYFPTGNWLVYGQTLVVRVKPARVTGSTPLDYVSLICLDQLGKEPLSLTTDRSPSG